MKRGRRPSINYWERGGGAYWTTYESEQIMLAKGPKDDPDGPTYAQAVEAFARVIRDKENKGTDFYAVSAVFNRYLEHLERQDAERGKRYAKQWQRAVRPFVDKFGAEGAYKIKPLHLTEIFTAHPHWGPGTRRQFSIAVGSAFKYAARQGYIPTDPLSGKVQKPEALFRGREFLLPDELIHLLLEGITHPDARRLFRFIYLTGCRPIEARHIKCENYRNGRFVLLANAPAGEYRHKTGRKTKKDRVIHVPPAMVDELAAVVLARPRGYVFQTRRGSLFRASTLAFHWCKGRDHPPAADYMREHHIDPDHVIPYSLRHTFLSRWVDTGRSVYIAAQLCGTSVTMIERCYGHPNEEMIGASYTAFLSEAMPGGR